MRMIVLRHATLHQCRASFDDVSKAHPVDADVAVMLLTRSKMRRGQHVHLQMCFQTIVPFAFCDTVFFRLLPSHIRLSCSLARAFVSF
jgi:hypothetical protein